MIDPTSGFLRFEVCGQIFALPMTGLAGIRQTSEVSAGAREGAPGEEAHTYVAPVSLAALFFEEKDHQGEEFVVVVHAEDQMYVLRVDRVLAGTEMLDEERSVLPSIIAAIDSPFTGMFWDVDRWGLVIDATALARMIRQRYPDIAAEHIYEIR